MPQRYVLTLMGFLGLVMAYSMRLSLSVAITQMVLPPIMDVGNLTLAGDQPIVVCPVLDENYYKEHFDEKAIYDSHYNPVRNCIDCRKCRTLFVRCPLVCSFALLLRPWSAFCAMAFGVHVCVECAATGRKTNKSLGSTAQLHMDN